MKTISIKLLLVALILTISSCKNGSSTSFSDYKFADQKQEISCPNLDNKLLNEALYSFEKDITTYFDIKKQNVNLAHNTFAKQATGRKPDFTKFVSKHSVAIATTLKNAGFIGENGMNYNNPITKCIGDNMQPDGLKITFNALVSTNSMRRELFNPALQTKTHKIAGDKYLAMYVALEYFYAEILKIDFTNVDFNRAEGSQINEKLKNQVQQKNNQKVDFNKRPRKQ